MRTIDLATLETIGRGEYAHTWLLAFDIPDGSPPVSTTFGFWPGAGIITVSGVDYVGAGSLISIEQIDMGVDLSASPLTVSLRAVSENLTPDVLATIDDYAYKNRPARLSLAYFNPLTGALITTFLWWQGYIDVVSHEEQIGGDYILRATLEPKSLDHSRIGHRMRSDTDQKLIDATDLFFEHAATVASEEIKYGGSNTLSSSSVTKRQPGSSGGSTSSSSAGGWTKRMP